MSNVEHHLDSQITEIEQAVLRAEVKAYGRVYGTPLPEFRQPDPEPPIKFGWWLAAMAVSLILWMLIVVAIYEVER